MPGEDKEKEPFLTLKRVVTIKVIVTEQFKKYLGAEVERAIRNLDLQAQQMEFQAKRYLQDLEDKGMVQEAGNFKNQLSLEKQRQDAVKSGLTKKIEEANNLALGSEFIQGTVDGWVKVKKGENLYEKLGAMEITIKDGMIQDIAPLSVKKKPAAGPGKDAE